MRFAWAMPNCSQASRMQAALSNLASAGVIEPMRIARPNRNPRASYSFTHLGRCGKALVGPRNLSAAPLGLKPESPAEVRAARLWLGATPGNKPGRVAERAPRTPGGGARLGQGDEERPAAQLA
jgi:hypothetical protein